MRISDWSSVVFSSDLSVHLKRLPCRPALAKLCDGFYDGFSGISLLIASDFRRFDAQFSSSSGHHLFFRGRPQTSGTVQITSFFQHFTQLIHEAEILAEPPEAISGPSALMVLLMVTDRWEKRRGGKGCVSTG